MYSVDQHISNMTMKQAGKIMPFYGKVTDTVNHPTLEIKGSTLLVYAYLCCKADKLTGYIKCQTYEIIASKLGISTPTVKSSIKKLIDLHYMKLLRAGRKGSSAEYQLLYDRLSYEIFSQDFLESAEITPKQKAALMKLQYHINKEEGMTLEGKSNTQIAKIVGINKDDVPFLLQSLEDRNFIERREDSIKFLINNYHQDFLINVDKRLTYTEKEIQSQKRIVKAQIKRTNDLNQKISLLEKEIKRLQMAQATSDAKMDCF